MRIKIPIAMGSEIVECSQDGQYWLDCTSQCLFDYSNGPYNFGSAGYYAVPCGSNIYIDAPPSYSYVRVKGQLGPVSFEVVPGPPSYVTNPIPKKQTIKELAIEMIENEDKSVFKIFSFEFLDKLCVKKQNLINKLAGMR